MGNKQARRKRRAPRWASRSSKPGRASFTEARAAGRSPLPAGVWHADASTASLLATVAPTIRDATHIPSGARFRLACTAAGAIIGLCGDDEPAEALIAAAWGDPVKWAHGEHWWIDPASTTQKDG